MHRGKIKSYKVATGTGVITPRDGGQDVFFLKFACQGAGPIKARQAVKYELKRGRAAAEREAKRVIPDETPPDE